jgi:hypothetical protein
MLLPSKGILQLSPSRRNLDEWLFYMLKENIKAPDLSLSRSSVGPAYYGEKMLLTSIAVCLVDRVPQ